VGIVFQDVGLAEFVDAFLSNTGAGPVFLGQVMLYTNNFAPANGSVAADFTECVLAGYARSGWNSSSWSGSSAGGLAVFSRATIAFSFNPYGGPNVTIYGYCVVNQSTGDPFYAELFSAPYIVPNGGGVLDLTMQWQSHLC